MRPCERATERVTLSAFVVHGLSTVSFHDLQGTRVTVLEDLKNLESSIVKRYRELQPAIAEVDELRRVAERLGVDLDAPTPARTGRNGRGAASTRAKPRRRAA